MIFVEDPGRLDEEAVREGFIRMLVRDTVTLELSEVGEGISVLGVGGVETVTEDDREWVSVSTEEDMVVDGLRRKFNGCYVEEDIA